MLSVYLSICYPSKVYAVDIQDKNIHLRFEAEFEHYRRFFGASGDYAVAFQDGRRLGYKDDAFDLIYSLSVVEHIPHAGDSETMAEIGRVLKPGGIAVIEVPYARRSKETFLKRSVYEREYQNTPLFYQRHYDDASLRERLIIPSGLKLCEEIFFVERLPFELCWNKLPDILKVPFLWLEPIISSINHVQFDGFQANSLRVTNGCMSDAIMFLRKGWDDRG